MRRVSLLYLAASAATLVGSGVTATRTPASPPELLFALAALAVVAFVVVAGRGERVGSGDAAAVLVLSCASILVMTGATRSAVGAITDGNALTLAGLYAAWFVPRPATRAVLVPAAVAYAAIVTVRDLDGVAFYAVISAMQAVVVTEVVMALRRRLDHHATTDPLTGALNRRGLERAARDLLRDADRRGVPVSVVAIDLDGLKATNDAAGHAAGDDRIRHTAALWRAGVGDGLVARVGGDEFLVVTRLPRVRVDEVVEAVRTSAPGGWSHGIATARPGEGLDTAWREADAALRRAKEERDA